MDSIKVKTIASASIILLTVMAVVLSASSTSVGLYHNPGIIIDFGDRETNWASVDFSESPDAISSVESACITLGFGYDFEGLETTAEYGTAITLPMGLGLKKDGLRFVGWSTTNGGNLEYAPGESYSIPSSDVTLYAVWVSIGAFVISFNNCDGTGSTADIIDVGLVNLPSGEGMQKAGCTFSGWSLTKNGAKDYNSGQAFDLRADTVLYAVWTLNSGTVLDTSGDEIVKTSDENETFKVSYNSLGGGPVGVLTEVNGVSSTSLKVWALWGVKDGETELKRIMEEPAKAISSHYSAVSWVYCDWENKPSIVVDQTGVSFYGYSVPNRIITLAPSVTETVCSVGMSNFIIGTDLYSNYPDSVVKRRDTGEISVTGGYTNPSFETILKLNPDMVFCEGAQASHLEIAKRLRTSGINAVVMYEGESIDTVMNNIFIAGVASQRTSTAIENIDNLNNAIGTIQKLISDDAVGNKSVMVALSAMKSPYVSGSNTYIADIFKKTFGLNIFESLNGWIMVNAEKIAEFNPEVIIVISDGDYQTMYNSLSMEWKTTTAYANDEIYLLSGSAMDLASRPGPRIAQATELIGRILHQSSFPDSIVVPNWVSNNYTDYLTYTKNLGFDKV